MLIDDGSLEGGLVQVLVIMRVCLQAGESSSVCLILGRQTYILLREKIRLRSLIADSKEGFYITNLMGMLTANPITGDFSVGAAGIWLKNGKFSHAVWGGGNNCRQYFRAVPGY